MELKTIDQLLTNYSSLRYNDDKTKIKCEWTGHELPLRVEAIQTYVNGNKYKNLLKKNPDHDQSKKYMEFLVQSNKPHRENQYFCKLTLRHLNKQPDHVQKHLNGKRFQKAYKHWLYCQENNIEFVPFSKQLNSRPRPEADESDNQDDSDSDQMSDLFPEEMFDLIEEDGDDDKEVNDLNEKIEKHDLNEKETKMVDDKEEDDDEVDNGDNNIKSKQNDNNNKKNNSKIKCFQPKRDREFKPTKKSVQPKKKKKI